MRVLPGAGPAGLSDSSRIVRGTLEGKNCVIQSMRYTRTIEDYLTQEVELPAKGVAPNVDFYSGSVYKLPGIPIDDPHEESP